MVYIYIDIHRALVYFTGPELTCRKASYCQQQSSSRLRTKMTQPVMFIYYNYIIIRTIP